MRQILLSDCPVKLFYNLVAGQELEQARVVDAFLIAIWHDVVFDDDNLLDFLFVLSLLHYYI